MSWLSNLMHPGRAYSDAAQTQQNYYNQAQGQLAGVANPLLDPVSLQNKWTESYQTSPYAQQLLNQSKAQGMDLAQSMGLGGSSTAIQGIQNTAGNIMQQDRQQYLNDLMQKYMTGAGIMGQMGQQTYNMGQDQAGLKFGQGQAGSNQLMQLLSAIIGGVAGIGD